jgi:hypothetical protein
MEKEIRTNLKVRLIIAKVLLTDAQTFHVYVQVNESNGSEVVRQANLGWETTPPVPSESSPLQTLSKSISAIRPPVCVQLAACDAPQGWIFSEVNGAAEPLETENQENFQAQAGLKFCLSTRERSSDVCSWLANSSGSLRGCLEMAFER